jgi:thiol-disulfide isomerase/thioredoxin
VRRALVALAAAVLVVTAAGCDDVKPPGRSAIDVDTPKLREMKADAGVEPCAEGPGGGELPELTLPCLGGGDDVDLSTLRGPMLINLWASNCGPCVKEMPALEQFHQRYGDRVAVLGIDAVDTQPEAALALMADTGATYPSLADPGGTLYDEPGLDLGQGLPQFLLLDDAGRIAHRAAGGLESLPQVVALVEDHLEVTL